MKINVSTGEILDKYSILEIKKERITDPIKHANVMVEFEELRPVVFAIYKEVADPNKLGDLYTDLININRTLWNIENLIRKCEADETFGEDFIELARSVYYTNDERAEVKSFINELTGSVLVEQKFYEEYNK